MERALAPSESASGTHGDRCAAVREAINAIADPCSIALVEPIGLGDLGLVEDVRIAGGDVEVSLVPTSPHCLFLGLFEEQIESRVGALDWVDSVVVRLDEGETIWDETRMTASARERLRRRRAAVAAKLSHRGTLGAR